jgi:hypothetical protein
MATGHEADIPAIDQKREDIRGSFDAKYWKGSWYISDQVTTPDDRANAMAVNVGLADRSKWDAIYDNVLSHKTNASCFFDRWVFEALCTMGREKQALLRMEERYRTEIPCSFTTLWEHYDRWWASWKNAYDDASSLNHGWNPPALLLSQTIAGISPVEPGWSTYHVLPKEAFLTSINAMVPSIKGDVAVHILKSATQYELTLTSPPGTTAIVGIPRHSFTALREIRANNIAIWDGTSRGGADGIAFDGEDVDYVRFKAPPGTSKFVGIGTLPMDSAKSPAVPAPTGHPLDKKSWTAWASVPDGTFPFSGAKIPIDISAANAIDGDHWTGWRDMTKTQYPGHWLAVDMQKEQDFDKIVLDNTWAQWDFPRGYAVAVSNDGKTWTAPVATGAGKPGLTTITFPKQHARYIRISQTGADPTYHWSVYELDVYDGNE